MIEQLFSLLKKMPEYTGALESLRQGENVAITGIGQINRSHILAGLCRELGRPMVLLCQDDIAARRLQEELKSFLEADVTMPPWCLAPGSRSGFVSSMICVRGAPPFRL